MREEPLIYSSDPSKIDLRLSKAEAAVGATQNAFSVRLVLSIVMPKAYGADFVLAASIQCFEFAAWAPEPLSRSEGIARPRHLLAWPRSWFDSDAHAVTLGRSVVWMVARKSLKKSVALTTRALLVDGMRGESGDRLAILFKDDRIHPHSRPLPAAIPAPFNPRWPLLKFRMAPFVRR
jgi:hypothetical protein